MSTVPVDLHDTENCPLRDRCQSCGYQRPGLTVTTASTALGVHCTTACPDCLAAGIAPPLPPSSVVRLVMDHCGHLGIDADEMADQLQAERPGAGASLTPVDTTSTATENGR